MIIDLIIYNEKKNILKVHTLYTEQFRDPIKGYSDTIRLLGYLGWIFIGIL